MKSFAKKLFGVLVIAAAMTACNNSGDASSTGAADSAAKAATDSVKPSTDTSAKKMDSTAVATDTTKKM